MRNYIDCSYNIAIASAVDDVEGSNITSKNSHIIKSTTIDSLNPNNKVKFSINDKKNSKSSITWEDVFEILKEVQSIEIEKKVSRKVALKKYTQKQRISNVFKISKYMIGNTIKTLIPGSEFMNAAINIFSDVTINATSECIEDKFKMQSFIELISDLKKYKNNKSYTQKAISSLDYYSCSFYDL